MTGSLSSTSEEQFTMIPSPQSPPSFKVTANLAVCVAWLALIACTIIVIKGYWGAVAFSPDSWAYFELSQSFWSDFYKISHYRSYWTSDYSAAFPPLWPAVIAIANAVLDLGPNMAIIMNMFVILLIAVVSESISKSSFNVSGPGVVMTLALLMHRGFFSEIVSGRSIPLFILLGLTALRLMSLKNPSDRILHGLALGLVLAAMFMTRFDGMLWLVVLFPFILWLHSSWKGIIAFAVAYAAGISPWVIYSLSHFDSFLVSDNSWVANALDPNAFVTDYPAAAGATLTHDPILALKMVMRRMPDFLKAIVKSPKVPGYIILILCGIFLIRARRGGERSHLVRHDNISLSLIAIGLAIMSASSSYLLTGYFDERYFSFQFAFLVFLLLVGLWQQETTKRRAAHGLAYFIAVASVAYLVNKSQHDYESQINLAYEDNLAQCLQLEKNHAPILVEDANQAARLTALYGIKTAFIPGNFVHSQTSDHLQTAFLKQFRVEYVIDKSGLVAKAFNTQSLTPVPDCGLDVFSITSSARALP